MFVMGTIDVGEKMDESSSAIQIIYTNYKQPLKLSYSIEVHLAFHDLDRAPTERQRLHPIQSIVQRDRDTNIALPTHLNSLRHLIRNLLHPPLQTQKRTQSTRCTPRSRIFQHALDHPRPQLHPLTLVLRTDLDIEQRSDKPNIPLTIQLRRRSGARTLNERQRLEIRQLHAHEVHTSHGTHSIDLQDLPALQTRLQLLKPCDGERRLDVQVHIVRDRSLRCTTVELGFHRAGGQVQAALRASRRKGAEHVACGADGRVAGEGQLGVCHEDAGAPFGCARLGGGGVFIVEVEEDGFGEVEFSRDGLEGRGWWVLSWGDADDG